MERRDRLLRWAAVIGAGALIIIIPRPPSLQPNAWYILAVFAATMIGLITQPLPGSAMVLIAVGVVAVTGIAPVATTLAGYSDPVVWLVLAAFFISRGMINTGLGHRIALLFIRKIGHTTLGLAYALGMSEVVLGSIIPSTGARTGGVIFPIGKSLAEAYDSRPGPTARRLGTFLMLFMYSVNVIVCATFLTGQASNAIIATFARDAAKVDLSYARWLLGASIPAMLSLAIVPLLIYKLSRPEITKTPLAAERARADLQQLGPMSRDERIMAAVFGIVLALWLTKAFHGIDYVAVALIGVGALLVTRVLKWEDVTSDKHAWDVFLWYGGLVQLAKLLAESGIPTLFAHKVAGAMGGWSWTVVLAVIILVYFYAHYGFASITAHVTAMYLPFLAVCMAAGAPPMLAAVVLAYISNLSASLTHYGTTSAPIYYGGGYVTQGEWWRIGFIVSVINLAIWCFAGALWWKLLGWW